MNSWIQTFSGIAFDLLAPRSDMVCIEDIAHALSLLCRFTGHTRKHYSVAQHSHLVAVIASRAGDYPGIMRQALMHDATEAYIGDLPTPLKRLLPEYREIERKVWLAIAERFALPVIMHEVVKAADMRALVTERRDFLGKSPQPWAANIEAIAPCDFEIRPWKARMARREFLHLADIYRIK